MKNFILSPLAVICALGMLYPSLSHTKTEEIEWTESVQSENEELLSFFEEEEQMQEETPVATKEKSPSLKLELKIELELDDQESLFSKTTPSQTPQQMAKIQTPVPSQQAMNKDEPQFAVKQPLNTPLFTANNSPTPTPMPAPTTEQTSFLSIGGSYNYVHFKPASHSSFHGNLGGMQALYEYRPTYGFYGALKASWRQGDLTTSGASRFLVDVKTEERIGFTVNSNDKQWLWTFFSGLGFSYLNHNLKERGATSTRFVYNEFYCPVGISTDYSFSRSFALGLHATWMPQIFPTVTITPNNGARWKTTCSLGNTLLEMPFTWSMGKEKQFFINLIPHFEYWQNGHTTAKTASGEPLGLPSNTYFFWGADVNIGYAF